MSLSRLNLLAEIEIETEVDANKDSEKKDVV